MRYKNNLFVSNRIKIIFHETILKCAQIIDAVLSSRMLKIIKILHKRANLTTIFDVFCIAITRSDWLTVILLMSSQMMLRGSLLFGFQNVNYSGKRGIKFFKIGTKPTMIRLLSAVGATYHISSRLLVQFHLPNTCACRITLPSTSQRLGSTPSKNGCRKPTSCRQAFAYHLAFFAQLQCDDKA